MKEYLSSFVLYIIAYNSLIFLGIVFLIWYKYGRDKKDSGVVNFYPPKGLNSAEAGAILNGSVSNRDIVSLLFYLSGKGFIEIKSLDAQNDILFIMKKKYSGQNEVERLFMKEIFQNKKQVSMRDLRRRYLNFDPIKTKINSKMKKKYIIQRNLQKTLTFILIIVAIFSLNIGQFIVYETKYFEGAISFFLVSAFIQPLAFGISFFLLNKKNKNINIYQKSLFIGLFMLLGLLLSDVFEISAIISYFINVIFILLMIYIYLKLPQKNELGEKLFNEISGFKKYLVMVEKEKLEKMIKEDSQYFSKILPYIYVFDIKNKLLDKFDNIDIRIDDVNNLLNFSYYDVKETIKENIYQSKREINYKYGPIIDFFKKVFGKSK